MPKLNELKGGTSLLASLSVIKLRMVGGFP